MVREQFFQEAVLLETAKTVGKRENEYKLFPLAVTELIPGS